MALNYEIGRSGEKFACKILEAKGYKVLEKNFNCSFGEIDIIASKGNTIFFVEVKTRLTLSMGRPADAVNKAKCLRIRNVANYYIQKNHLEDYYISFQVIEVFVNQIEDAFC